jgi:hypothetical protein
MLASSCLPIYLCIFDQRLTLDLTNEIANCPKKHANLKMSFKIIIKD